MNTQHGLFIFLPLLPTLFVGFVLPSIVALHRSDFPDSFIFGTASSAYQYEGAVAEGGRGASIWDTFAHKHPEKIQDRSNGDVALDSYHRYKEDVDTIKDLGMDAYRFSVSWSRILPNGSLSGGINKAGVEYYNNLINYIISRGMNPFLTLFHWDTPQALEDAYGGFLSEKITNDFKDYADVCFREFGDRVKHWITFNEPCTFSGLGYASGSHAPGRCSISASGRCPSGDSGREPYMVSHNILLAHGATSKLFRKKYKDSQKGSVGITLDSNWLLPLSNAKSDIDATQRALDFKFGWFMDPLTEGDYPFIMKALVGDRLPKFTLEQSELVKGSIDFLGINYYTSYYVIHDGLSAQMDTSYFYDSWSSTTGIRNGEPIGPQAASPWLYVYPEGLKELLLHAKNKYNNPIIYVTENGVDEANNDTISLQEALQDNMRVEYYRSHILHVRQAMREGADVRGYFAWSLYDNFEWADGYTVRFGLHYVDYKNGLKRYAKKSAFWFQKFLERRGYDRNAQWSPRKL